MKEVRYIHAADLHLDTPFAGISRDLSPAAGKLLKRATFDALDTLATLCETERPDFLLLAGDIYNEEERSIRAQLRLRDICVRLNKLDIPVFVVHGNHDPLTSALTSINWPGNVEIFGANPSSHLVARNGEPLAIVHGASHATASESRNLAALFRRDPSHTCFQIGLLHTSLNGLAGEAPYAPCTMQDLRNSGLDAWALGHAHVRQVVSREPFIAYSGNTQGLNPKETGAKGCYLVSAVHSGVSWKCTERFVELAPLRWENLEINVDGLDALDEVMGKAHDAFEDMLTDFKGSKGLIASLTLQGKSKLDKELRSPSVLEYLREICSGLSTGHSTIWLRSLDVRTTPEATESAPVRNDLIGAITRLAASLEASDTELAGFMEMALKPLYGNRRVGGAIPCLSQREMADLVEEALAICRDKLETR